MPNSNKLFLLFTISVILCSFQSTEAFSVDSTLPANHGTSCRVAINTSSLFKNLVQENILLAQKEVESFDGSFDITEIKTRSLIVDNSKGRNNETEAFEVIQLNYKGADIAQVATKELANETQLKLDIKLAPEYQNQKIDKLVLGKAFEAMLYEPYESVTANIYELRDSNLSPVFEKLTALPSSKHLLSGRSIKDLSLENLLTLREQLIENAKQTQAYKTRAAYGFEHLQTLIIKLNNDPEFPYFSFIADRSNNKNQASLPTNLVLIVDQGTNNTSKAFNIQENGTPIPVNLDSLKKLKKKVFEF